MDETRTFVLIVLIIQCTQHVTVSQMFVVYTCIAIIIVFVEFLFQNWSSRELALQRVTEHVDTYEQNALQQTV